MTMLEAMKAYPEAAQRGAADFEARIPRGWPPYSGDRGKAWLGGWMQAEQLAFYAR